MIFRYHFAIGDGNYVSVIVTAPTEGECDIIARAQANREASQHYRGWNQEFDRVDRTNLSGKPVIESYFHDHEVDGL